MEKYSCLQSSNEYINFTLKNYFDCYYDLSVEDIQRLIDVFDLFKTHKISLGNVLIDDKAPYGLKLDKVDSKESYRSTRELNDQLKFLTKSIDASDKKEMIFFQSVTHLCDSIQFLNAEEMMNLNDMFQGITNHKQALGDKVSSDSSVIFFPFNRAPKKNII